MDREELEKYITDAFNADAEFPWAKYPNYIVFRHSNNKKWFALIMDVPKEKLSLNENGTVSVVNLKCDPVMVDILLSEPGFFPAYHMNKKSWITIALNDNANADKIKMLIDMSFDLTSSKVRKHKTSKKK